MNNYSEVEHWSFSNDTDDYVHTLMGYVRDKSGVDVLFVDRRELLCSSTGVVGIDEFLPHVYMMEEQRCCFCQCNIRLESNRSGYPWHDHEL